MEPELDEIVTALRAGRPSSPVTVRTFLGWFDAQRRGVNVVYYIRQQLAEAGLITVPDFESAWIDGTIELCLRDKQSDRELSAMAPAEGSGTTADPLVDIELEPPKSWVGKDPTYRISKLAAANEGVTSIAPDASLKEAVTLDDGDRVFTASGHDQ